MTLWLSLIALVGGMSAVGVILFRQWRSLRRGEAVETAAVGSYQALGDLAQGQADRAYFHFAFFFKQFGHYSYFFTLLCLRGLAQFSRALLHRLERRCSRLIDSIHSQGVISKKGSASLFLMTLKAHKDGVIAKLKTE